MTEPCSLYRLFDRHDNLLYIGISSDPARRLREHKERTAWAWLVKRTEVEEYENREGAHAAERSAIRAERPEHNQTRFIKGDGDWRGIDDPDERLAARQALVDSGMAKLNRFTWRNGKMELREPVPTPSSSHEVPA